MVLCSLILPTGADSHCLLSTQFITHRAGILFVAVFYKLLSALGVLLFILLCVSCADNDTIQQPKPNILLILTDDLGNNDVASWGDGVAPTPAIDHLSRDAVRFRRHTPTAPAPPAGLRC